MLESCKPGLEQSCWVEIFRPQTNSLTSCGAPLVVLIGSVSIIWSGHNTSGRTLSEEAKPQQQKRNTRADWAEGRRKQQGLRTVGGRDSNTAAGALEGEGRGSNLVKRLNWHYFETKNINIPTTWKSTWDIYAFGANFKTCGALSALLCWVCMWCALSVNEGSRTIR